MGIKTAQAEAPKAGQNSDGRRCCCDDGMQRPNHNRHYPAFAVIDDECPSHPDVTFYECEYLDWDKRQLLIDDIRNSFNFSSRQECFESKNAIIAWLDGHSTGTFRYLASDPSRPGYTNMTTWVAFEASLWAEVRWRRASIAVHEGYHLAYGPPQPDYPDTDCVVTH
jgi:hypothetical protein